MGRKIWERLAEIVGGFQGHRIAVLGDLVLDRFWYGDVQRVSREAPVPIVRLSGIKLFPGCAANTVSNLSALGAVPRPVGVVGQDKEGSELLGLFADSGIPVEYVVREEFWTTPTKTRVLAGNPRGSRQQLVRVDSGEQNEYTAKLKKRLREAMRLALEGSEALVFSDYGYGVVEALGTKEYAGCTPVSALDSRFALTSYPGVNTATPNEEEFERACGCIVGESDETLEREGEKLRCRLGYRALLVTRGKRGMCLFEEGEKPFHIQIVGPDQVIDVTGAGDTVMASYVLSLCAGASYREAAMVANIAGGIVVQRHGTATTSPGELVARIEAWGRGLL